MSGFPHNARRQVEAFAPPAARARQPRIEQVKVAFPVAARIEYRWRFPDGTLSPWKPAPTNDLLLAPPGSAGCEWRERPQSSAKASD